MTSTALPPSPRGGVVDADWDDLPDRSTCPDEWVADELQAVQRRRAIDAAEEAQLILALALRPGWQFRLDDDGTLHVTTPSGVTRTTRPPGLRTPVGTPAGIPPLEARPPGPDPTPAHDPPPF